MGESAKISEIQTKCTEACCIHKRTVIARSPVDCFYNKTKLFLVYICKRGIMCPNLH